MLPTISNRRYKPDQRKELTYFARAFAKNIDEHSKCERKKYPKKYDPPKSIDVIIDEKTAARIERLLGSWRQRRRGRYSHRDEFSCEGKICGHYDEDKGECRCPVLPHEHRIASAFCWPYEFEPCYQFEHLHPEGCYNQKVLRSMIMYGEIDPILRRGGYRGLAGSVRMCMWCK